MTVAEAAYAAGVMDTQGTFSNTKIFKVKNAGRTVSYRFDLISAKRMEMVYAFGNATGLEIQGRLRDGAQVPRVSVWGEELHEIMKQLWPYLTRERKQEYADVRRASEASVIAPTQP